MSYIAERLQAVRLRVAVAAAKAQRRPEDIRLLAVSKTFSSECVAAAFAAGQHSFGENYVQEALPKIAGLATGGPIEWHLIGPLQSNKTAVVATHFSWVHSIDRERIAVRLSEARPAGGSPLSVCIQVNISNEDSKAGVRPDATIALAKAVAGLPRIRVRGLMGIADPAAGDAEVRAQFRLLRDLLDAMRTDGLDVDTLSMGMSADLEAAIAEGSTMVRIGTAIFGDRHREAG
ncbi:MAG: YggS family pyridoxal phosphate-dependent enzyme [Casimicrobiaceae bacterium]